MSKRGDYIERGDGGFNDFFKNMIQYVAVKTGGNKPEWNHVIKTRYDELLLAYESWYTAYAVCLKPHTDAETRTKNNEKEAAVKVIRPFVQQFLMFPPVMDADRINMRLPIRDKIHSTVPRPGKPPVFTMKPKDNRIVRIDYRAEEGGGRAKPYGYTGAVINYALLDHQPTDYKELTEHKLVTRTPYAIEFTEANRGKRLYVAIFWQNTKGEQGPWSDIQMTVVP